LSVTNLHIQQTAGCCVKGLIQIFHTDELWKTRRLLRELARWNEEMAARKWKTLYFPCFLLTGFLTVFIAVRQKRSNCAYGREPPGFYDMQTLVWNICGPCTRNFYVLSYVCYVLGDISTMCCSY